MKKIENKPYRERELPTGQHSRSHAVKHQLHNSMDLPGKGRGKMKIKLLNTEHGIGSCNTEDVPVWVTKFGPAEYLAFFYFYQRDLIVLNEDHPKFKLYKTIVVEYEEFSSLSKKRFASWCEQEFPEILVALKHLDYINRIRRNLYQRMKEGEAL